MSPVSVPPFLTPSLSDPAILSLLTVEVQRAAFSSLAHVIKTVHSLRLPTDKHGRNVTLSSYVQYVFGAPEGPSNASAFDVRHSTASRSRSSVYEEDVSRRSSTSRRPMVVKSSEFPSPL